MSEPKLLTISIPTYNRAEILDSALWAICPQAEQMSDKVCVLVVDNASEDETPQVVEKHQRRWSVLRYVRNDTNLGLMGNFAEAARLPDSEWVWWLGDDDLVFPFSTEVVLQKLSEIMRREDIARPVCLAVLDWFAMNKAFSKLKYPSLQDENCSDRIFDPGIRVLEEHNYHSLAPLSRLILRRKVWDAGLFAKLHRPYHLYTHVRCCMKIAESLPVATIGAPIVGGGEKGDRSYYHAILPVAQLEEFAELDRNYLSVMQRPNWLFRRRQIKRGIYLNLFALKMGIFYDAYRRHFHVVNSKTLTLLQGGAGAWIARRLAKAESFRRGVERLYLRLRPNMTIPKNLV